MDKLALLMALRAVGLWTEVEIQQKVAKPQKVLEGLRAKYTSIEKSLLDPERLRGPAMQGSNYAQAALLDRLERAIATFQQHIDEGSITVQFCPCGHVYTMSTAAFVKLAGNRNQLEEIESGKKLDAPILHSSHCDECAEDRQRYSRYPSY